MIFNQSHWIGDIIFAFDNIKDKELIIDRLQMIRRHTNKIIKFYVFCGFNHDDPGQYDINFYHKDIHDLFERIKILMQYGCLPYVMQYKDCKKSFYKGLYTNVGRWCNQVAFFKKTSFREFCMLNQDRTSKICAAVRGLQKVERDFPDISSEYFNMKWDDFNETSNT